MSDTENSDDNNNNNRDNEPIAKKTRVSNEADPPTVTAHDVTDATGNNQHVRGLAKIHENPQEVFAAVNSTQQTRTTNQLTIVAKMSATV